MVGRGARCPCKPGLILAYNKLESHPPSSGIQLTNLFLDLLLQVPGNPLSSEPSINERPSLKMVLIS